MENGYSTAVEIAPPKSGPWNYELVAGAAYGPATPIWTYADPGVYYGGRWQGDVQRLPNGNTLICSALTGYIFEVTEAGAVVWDYDHGESVGRAQRYWEDTTAIAAAEQASPAEIPGLLRNAPNPFTTVSFDTPREGRLRLAVFDVRGRRVAVLANGHYRAGTFQTTWNGLDARGRAAASGTYFLQLEAEAFGATRKMTLTR